MKKPKKSRYSIPNSNFIRVNDKKTAESIAKGYAFEQYVAAMIAKNYNYNLIAWQSDKQVNGIFPALSMDPDLIWFYENKYAEFIFAVECKWRGDYWNNGIEWARPEQFEHYLEFEECEDIPVTIVLGVGGSPDMPEDLYVIPLEDIEYPFLYKSVLNRYKKRKGDTTLKFDTDTGNVN